MPAKYPRRSRWFWLVVYGLAGWFGLTYVGFATHYHSHGWDVFGLAALSWIVNVFFARAAWSVVRSLFGIGRKRLTTAQRRQLVGQCVGCGYDLRGSSDRCPECGRERPVDIVQDDRSAAAALLEMTERADG